MDRHDLRKWARRRTRAGERGLVLVVKHITPIGRKAYDAGFWMRPEEAAQVIQESKQKFKEQVQKFKELRREGVEPSERPRPEFRQAKPEEYDKLIEARKALGAPAMPVGRTWRGAAFKPSDATIANGQAFLTRTVEMEDGPPPEIEYEERHDTPQGRARAEIHKQAVDDLVSKVQPPLEGHHPVAVFMMGGTATGKSTALNAMFGPDSEIEKTFVRCDSDEMKKKIPEYVEGIDKDRVRGWSDKNSAAIVHEESSMMAKQAGARAIQEGKSFIWDGTGKSTATYQDFLDAVHAWNAENAPPKGTKQPYETRLIACDVPNVNDMKVRAGERAEVTGRWVPDKVVAEGHKYIPSNFAAIQREFDSAELFDTTEPKSLAVFRRVGQLTDAKGTVLRESSVQVLNETVWTAYSARASAETPRLRRKRKGEKTGAFRRWARRKFAASNGGQAGYGVPAFDLDTFSKMFEQALIDEREAMKTAPKQFKPGEGIIVPDKEQD